jgi:chromosome segregation ATPase
VIQSLTIQRRQSHNHSHLDLHEGVNLIVGSGDSGKSAILRSLFWPIYNTSGDSQVSNWAKKIGSKSGKVTLTEESSVTVTKPEGELVRFRNATENGYKVNGETLKAVGTNVPDQVQSFFNLSDVNIARQHSPYFLIDLPGGQVSAYLNRVVRLEEIDAYLSAAAGCLKDARAEQKAQIEAQDRDAKTLEALAWVDDIQGRIDALDALHKELQGAKDKQANLLQWLNMVKAANLDLHRAQRVTALSDKAQDVRRLQQASQGVGTRLKAVKSLRESWAVAISELETTAKVVRLHPRVKSLRGIVEELQVKATKAEGLKTLILRHTIANADKATASKVAKLHSRLEAVRSLVQSHKEQEGRWEALAALRTKWLDARKAIRTEGALDALDAKAKRLRKIWEKGQASRAKLEALRQWGLTYQGTMATLVKSRTEAVELAAKRPATCPYCGAGNHKGEGC